MGRFGSTIIVELVLIVLYNLYNILYDFKIIAVNLKEDNQIVHSFVSELSLTFSVLLDDTGEIAGTYGASTLPMTVNSGKILT